MKHKSQHDQDLELIDSIDVSSGLSEWEAVFVDSNLDRLQRDPGAILTDRQRTVAQNIQKRLDTKTT